MSLFLKTLSKEENLKNIPLWLMRQAGRYLPEYMAIRKDVPDFLSLVYNPDLAAEVTLQPIRRFGMDAAILFSDILVVPHALGQHVRFVKGEGPRLNGVLDDRDIDQLTFDEEILFPITQTIQKTRAALADDKALIGFAGSPWTVACYMVDGRGKTDFPKARQMMTEAPDLFQTLIDKIVQASIDYLTMQVDAGVNALQLFDSWAGLLSKPDFDQWVIKPTQKIVKAMQGKYPHIPIIGFAKDSQTNLADYAAQTNVQAIGISQKMDISWVKNNIPDDIVLQGNLDPELLLKGGNEMIMSAKNICDTLADRHFIFNLGHGVIKETPPDHVAELVEFVKGYKK